LLVIVLSYYDPSTHMCCGIRRGPAAGYFVHFRPSQNQSNGLGFSNWNGAYPLRLLPVIARRTRCSNGASGPAMWELDWAKPVVWGGGVPHSTATARFVRLWRRWQERRGPPFFDFLLGKRSSRGTDDRDPHLEPHPMRSPPPSSLSPCRPPGPACRL